MPEGDERSMLIGIVNTLEFQGGNPVCLKQQHRSRAQGRWCLIYQIIEKTTPVKFHIKNQLDGTVTKTHAEHIRLANQDDSNQDDWELPMIKRVGLCAKQGTPLSKMVKKCRKVRETFRKKTTYL